MKKFMRPCAIFLSVVMFLNMMDLGVFAETVQKVMDESNNPYYIADEDKIYDEELSSNSACIVMELEDKRDENTKQFLLSDHSVQAVIYAQPVHYLENGEWKDIDNSLQYEGKAFEDAAGYTNAANDFQVRFAEQTLQDEFISVQQGEYKLDWKYVGATDEVTPTPTSVPTLEPAEEPESEMPTENDAENSASDQPSDEEEPADTDEETTADPLLEDQQTINAADDEATAVTETDTDKIESSETEFTDESASSEMPTAEPSFTPEPTETPNPVASPEPMETLRPESSPKPSGPPLLLSRITILDEPALMMAAREDESGKTVDEAVAGTMKDVESNVVYKEALEDTDFKYQLVGKTLKENIVVHERKDSYSYTFELTAQGVTLYLNEEERTIYAIDSNTEENVFTIPAPIMYDASGVSSTDISYELKEAENGSYLFTIIADSEWINSNDRQFPVSIDPVVATETKASVRTTMVASAVPNENCSDRYEWFVGTDSYYYGRCWDLLNFDIPALNPGDVVIDAQMLLVLRSKSFSNTARDIQVNAHEVTSSWTRNTVTWNTKPSYNPLVYDYDLVKTTDPEEGYTQKRFNITKAVRGWYAGTANNGILLKAEDESVENTGKFIPERNNNYGVGGASGQKLTFDRAEYNTTKIRSSGTDGAFGNDDDIITTIRFDNAGRTTGTSVSTVGGIDLGASSSVLTAANPNSTGSDIKTLNRLSRAASIGQYTDNLIKNSNFDSLTDWNSAAIGSAAQTASVSTSEHYIGTSALSIVTTSCPANGAGRVGQTFTTSVLKPGQTYTASAYVKVPKNITTSQSGDYGAGIGVTMNRSGSSAQNVYSEYIHTQTDTAINNGWRRVSVTFTVPQDATNTQISMLLSNGVGTAYFDAVQVERGETASPYNVFQNSGFECGDGTNWFPVSMASGDGVSSDAAHSGSYSYKVSGNGKTNKYFVQEVPVTGSVYDSYIVSAWAKADAVADRDTEREFKVDIKITYTDGTTLWKKASFNATVSGWQQLVFAFDLNGTGNSGKTPKSVRADICYENQANAVYFDDVQLIKDESQAYTYDSDGNLISVVKNADQKGTMEYSNNNLIKETDAKGYSFTYTYDAHHNMTSATSQNNVKYTYTYDSKGNATDLSVTNKADSMEIKTEVEYTANGAYVQKQIDALGVASAVYDYDQTSGLLKSVTDGNGVLTGYKYDSNDRLTSVTRGGTTIGYTYDNNTNLLSAIDHNGFQYTFGYDAFGNRTQVRAGENLLSTYTYGENNGALQSVTYGNGFTAGYNYNAAGQLVSKSYNGETVYTWKYGTAGEAQEHVDIANSLLYNYDYDSTGRFIREAAFENGTRLYTTEYGYDLLNNVTKISNDAYGSVITQNYTYGKDNLPTSYTTSTGIRVDYHRDSLNRMYEQVVNTESKIYSSYARYSATDRGSSRYRSYLVGWQYIGNTAIRYTRDNNGNITKIEEGVRDGQTSNGKNYAAKAYYRYDDNNQLIWETSAYSNKTREYTYSGGNLVQVKEWDSFMPPSSAAVQTFALGSEEPENKEMLPCDEKSGYEVTDTEVIADEQPAEAVNEAPAEEVEKSTFAESEAETLAARAATVTG